MSVVESMVAITTMLAAKSFIGFLSVVQEIDSNGFQPVSPLRLISRSQEVKSSKAEATMLYLDRLNNEAPVNRLRSQLVAALITVLVLYSMHAAVAAATFTPIDPSNVPASRIKRDFDPQQAAILQAAFKKYLAITKAHGNKISAAWLPPVKVYDRLQNQVDARDIFVYANAIQQLLVERGDSVTNPKYKTQAINVGHITPSYRPRLVREAPPPPPPTPAAPPTLAPSISPSPSSPPSAPLAASAPTPTPCAASATPAPSVEEAWKDVSELSTGKNDAGGNVDRCTLPFESQLATAESGNPTIQGLDVPLIVLTIPIAPFKAQPWLQRNFGANLTNTLQFVTAKPGSAIRYGVIMGSCLTATAFSHPSTVLTIESSASSGASPNGIATPKPQHACDARHSASPPQESASPAPEAKGYLGGATSIYLGPIDATSKPLVSLSSHVNPDYDFSVTPRKDVDLAPPFSASYGALTFDVHLFGEIDVDGHVHTEANGGYLDLKPNTKVYVTGIFGVGNRILGALLTGTLTAADVNGDMGAIAAVVPDATAPQWNSTKFTSTPTVLIAYAHGSATVNDVMSGQLALKLEITGFAPTIAKASWPGLLANPVKVSWDTPWTVIYLAPPIEKTVPQPAESPH